MDSILSGIKGVFVRVDDILVAASGGVTAHMEAVDCRLRVSMGWWLLRSSAKILAFLRLSVNFFVSYG